MSKAVLVDTVKCIGCRGCQVACKSWNELSGVTTDNRGSCENPPQLSADTFTRIKFNELWYNNKFYWVFTKVQCMHCEYPGCAESCLVGALQKTEEGPVVYDDTKCIGCRYCVVACPYGSRSFNWRDPRPHIKKVNPDFPTRMRGVVEKCTFCESRLAKGEKPACVDACKEGALVFGDLEDPESEVRKALDGRFSIRRKPELGTVPEVYYLV